MDYIQVRIITSTLGIEPVFGRLYDIGIKGAVIEDRADFSDFAQNCSHLWDSVSEELIDKMPEETSLLVYVSCENNVNEQLSLIKQEMKALKEYDTLGEFGPLEIRTNTVSEEDWERCWKKYYKPLRIGKHLLIKPSWEDVEPKEDDLVIEMDPKMAFGTGTHETTKMCCEVLEEQVKEGITVLDIGTGSGILSIASALLGAKEVTAVDIDPVAVKVAKENAALMGLSDKINIICGNLADEINEKFDIVVANIIADAIVTLAPAAKECVKKDGIFIASGIINTRYEDVENALKKSGFKTILKKEDGDWVLVMSCLEDSGASVLC